MACTTILVGKHASYDGSTMIARNDDSGFWSFYTEEICGDPPGGPEADIPVCIISCGGRASGASVPVYGSAECGSRKRNLGSQRCE